MTWALIAHEKLANYNAIYALFHEQNPLRNRSLSDRVKVYSSMGRNIDPFNPEKVEHLIPISEF
jgi:hypothetical protein